MFSTKHYFDKNSKIYRSPCLLKEMRWALFRWNGHALICPALITQKSCAAGMCNVILSNYLEDIRAG